LLLPVFENSAHQNQSHHRSHGYLLHLCANARTRHIYYATLSTSLLVFPKPNVSSQLFLGFQISGSLKHAKTKYTFFDSSLSIDETSFLLHPTVFIGKDYTLPKKQKIFFQISFVPGVYESDWGWDWLTSFGFKIGYGF